MSEGRPVVLAVAVIMVAIVGAAAAVNRPLCDRAHVDIDFRDGLVEFEEIK